jgi:DNA polymerase-1
MIMQVHDELVLEVAEDQLDGLRARTHVAHGSARPTSPFPSSLKPVTAANWDEAH